MGVGIDIVHTSMIPKKEDDSQAFLLESHLLF